MITLSNDTYFYKGRPISDPNELGYLMMKYKPQLMPSNIVQFAGNRFIKVRPDDSQSKKSVSIMQAEACEKAEQLILESLSEAKIVVLTQKTLDGAAEIANSIKEGLVHRFEFNPKNSFQNKSQS